MEKQKLKVWWVPQVPMKAFEVPVDSVEEGVKIMDVLGEYDSFQYKNRIKPDYCNAGGINIWKDDCDGAGNPGWVDWYYDDGREWFDDPREYLKWKREVE